MRDLFFCHEGTKHSDRLEMSFFVFFKNTTRNNTPKRKRIRMPQIVIYPY